jgi:phosphate starvation-inducible PhoH-like protein
VTGDITQVDLPSDRVSGLIEIKDILCNIAGIAFVYFNETDVVRHRLVQEIIKAYDRHQPDAGSVPRPAGRHGVSSMTRTPPPVSPPHRDSSSQSH